MLGAEGKMDVKLGQTLRHGKYPIPPFQG